MSTPKSKLNPLKGPWKMRLAWGSQKGKYAEYEVYPVNPAIKKPFSPTELATIAHYEEHNKAIARLIAAAPDLLEALKMTSLDLHNEDYRGPCLCSECSFRKAAAIAIAKAEGNTN